jgi:hypothetical protein
MTYQGTDSNQDDPRWHVRLQSQARVLNDCKKIGLFGEEGRWLDYACGDGTLSNFIKEQGLTLLKYDKY